MRAILIAKSSVVGRAYKTKKTKKTTFSPLLQYVHGQVTRLETRRGGQIIYPPKLKPRGAGVNRFLFYTYIK